MKIFEIYKTLIKNDIKSQISYPLDFMLQIFVWIFFTATPFLGISLLFQKFTFMGQWTLWHIGMMYSIVGLSYDISRMFGRSLDSFHHYVKSGELDSLLLRPIPIAIQLLCEQLFLRRIAGIFQYLIVYTISLYHLSVSFNPIALITTSLCSIISCTLIFFALLFLYSVTCFFTIEKNSVSDYLIDGTSRVVFYPFHLMNTFMKISFFICIPFYLTLYKPFYSLFFNKNITLLTIFGNNLFSLMAGSIFFIISLFIFNKSLSLYQSSNA